MPKLNFTVHSNFSRFSAKTFWPDLIGSPTAFSLESRIFHGISLGLIGVATIYAP